MKITIPYSCLSALIVLKYLPHLPAVMGISKWGAVLVVGVVCIFYSALASSRLQYCDNVYDKLHTSICVANSPISKRIFCFTAVI